MPADFKLSVIEGVVDAGVASHNGHDRIIQVQVERTGVTIPSSRSLRMFSPRVNTEMRRLPSERAVGADAILVPYAIEEDLVFDLVVEPLLFGMLPLGSLETGVMVTVSAIVGSFLVGTILRNVPL